MLKMVPGNQPAVPATTQSLHCPDHPLPKQTITAVLALNAFGIPYINKALKPTTKLSEVYMEEYGYRQNSVDHNPEPVTMQEWLITMLILMIPIVNLVMPFVWAFGGGSNPSKANFFKAQLIFVVIGIILWFIFAGALMGYFMNFRYSG